MESDNGASSSTGHFLPVSVSCDDFNSILAQLQSAYLFEESKLSFKYTAAFLIRNSALEEKYNACREKKREQGYIDDNLKETYGFLLFDELSKAKSIVETGVLAGNGTCTTLGDPTKGVYLSMYSDCLDLNRWYHGKSGYIAVLRLTQGRVKKVSENYTQNLTEPTVGFDCHVSEQLPSVSSKTSSFLAFERTQYYLYELLDNGSTAQSPSLACPYAIVAFSYTDTKDTQQEKSKENKVACPYSPWMGTLQIGSQTFSVGIRSTVGALTRAKLPHIIKAEQAISMLNIRKLLPKAIFDKTLNGKASQEDLNCSLCEIVASNSEEKEKLTPLLLEIKEKNVALIISLSDGGFLVLIHISHFIFHDNDNGMTNNKVLQGVFVFPESQAIQRVTKNGQMKRSLPPDALRVLPLLTYAEGEIEKTSLNTNEDLCEIFVQYMQSYATLISPGLPSSPFREVSIFPDQYDVPDTHGHLYSTPEWTDKHWQSLKLYLNNANSFQLPVSKASEIFVAGQEVRREDLEDDIYICLSSPEEPSTSLTSIESEDRPGQECSTNVETPQDPAQPVNTLPQMIPKVQAQEAILETSSSILSTEKDDKCIEISKLPLRTDEPAEELIVSITSAAQTFGEKGLDEMKNDLSVTTELQTATLNSLSEIVQSKITLSGSDDSNLVTDSDSLSLGHLECAQSPSLQIVKTLLGKDDSFCMDNVTTQESEKHIDIAETQGKKQENDQVSSKTTQVLEQAVHTYHTDNALLKELETCTLRKKSERWGLKPVITSCGRIFIPYGSVDTVQIKSLQDKVQRAKDNMHAKERTADALSEVCNASNNKQEIGDDEEKTKPTEEGHQRKLIGHINLDKHELTSDTDCLLEEHKENRIKDIPIAEKSKGEIMLKRLKSVILKKRNTDVLRIGLRVKDDLENDSSPKRTRRDITPEIMKSSSDMCAKEINVDNHNLVDLPSVDPIFAHALGLTPKGTLDITCVQRNDLSVEKGIVLAKESPSCKQQPQSSPKGLGPRLKMLKKNQRVSAEQVKKKWWLHFQTPACYAEKQYEGCSRDISVRKTVKEKTDTSSEALNLLADLALSANKEQVSPHPIQACLQDLGSSLKNCEITKDVSNTEQQSVLHALLRQPTSKRTQPREPPAPESFGGSELVDVICQEHAYSLPSSPSLLLALPAPFQVSPLNGSSRLLQTQRLWDGVQTMHPIFSPVDKGEYNGKDPEDPKRSWYRRKFCQLRTIVNKENSVQVTRHWEGLYDFNLDSRFTVDPKDKTIVRALHGPWDFSIHDTTEEVQLIVHMWIGLFYSRSTARFFHFDPDMTLVSSEGALLDAVDLSSERGHELRIQGTVLSSSLTNAEDKLEPKILDLSKPKNCVVDKEPVVLNLSQRPSNVEKTHQSPQLKKVPDLTALTPQGLQVAFPFQWYWNPIHTTGNATPFTYIGVPVNEDNGISSELNHQLFIPLWEGIPNTSMWTNDVLTPALPATESNNFQIENASVPFTKSPESKIRKRVNRKRTQKGVYLSSINESRENQNMQQVKETLSKMNTATDLNPANVDEDMMRSKHLFEIKKKYMEKLASINQHVECPPSQNDKEVRTNLLKKLLLEDTIIDTPKPKQPSEYKTIPYETPQLNTSSCHENSSLNQSVVQRQHVFAFPKAFTTSIVTETTFPENRSEQTSFNIVGLAPSAQAENRKCTSAVDLVSVSSFEEKEKSAGQCMVMGYLSEFANQDIKVRKHDALIENTMDCSLCKDDSMNTVEQTDPNVSNSSTNEAKNNYGSVTIPFIGMNTSIEDMLKEETSHDMDKEKGVEDMEIATSDSSPAPSEVITPLPTSTDSTSQIVSNGLSNDAENNYRSVSIPFIGINTSIEDMLKEETSHDMDKEKGVEDMEIATSDSSPAPSEVVTPLPTSTDSTSQIVSNSLSNDAENNYRSVSIPFIGMNTSIEDMLKEDSSNDMDEEKGVEDMEIATSDSSPAHSEVATPLPTSIDGTSHNQPSKHIGKSVAESEINNPFDIGDGEADDRCPTPTIDEQPYVYTSQSNHNSGNDLDKDAQDVEKEAERSSTPVLDETSVNTAQLINNFATTAKVGAQSDIELRTLRTLQCLDEFLSTFQYKSNQLLNSNHSLNTSVTSNKSSALTHDFKDMKTTSSMRDSCPDSTQYLYASPSNDVSRGRLQLEEKSSNSLLSVPGMLSEDLNKVMSLTEKPDQTISKNEGPKSNTSSSISECPEITERPSKMYQGQIISLKQMANSDCDAQSKPIKFSIKRTKQGKFVCSRPVFDAHHANENCADNFVPSNTVQQDDQNLQRTEALSILPSQSVELVESTSKHVTACNTRLRAKASIENNLNTDEDLLNCKMSFVDSKTNKITDDSLGTEGSLSCTVTNTKRKGSSFLEKVSQRCLQDNATQSSMDRECLIFFDKMKQLLKRKNQCPQVLCDQPNLSSSSPIIVQFSHLQEQDDVFGGIQIPRSFFDQKIRVDMSDREQLRDVERQSSSKSLPHEELEQPGVSAITAECARLYRDLMNKICTGHRNTSLLKDLHKSDSCDSATDSCNYFDFCSQMKREMDDSFRNRLNSVVKKSCKTKNRFFLLVTSDDVFFNETRGYLEAEGHVAVQPSDFFLSESCSSPLLVIIRNEDIAEHIFKVPHLLQLRKSPAVQFAGIDEPDDVVNLTYQEVFIKGGFVMFDRAAVESLSPGNMRKTLEILKRLIQTGKWKWVLHYRDSRRLKENARLCPDAKEKTDILNECKEDGLLEVLPYHECDLMSREQPNYLQCLCHQQIQNISARYPVFVSDSETDKVFEKNGIVTMTVISFLMDSLSKIINGFT